MKITQEFTVDRPLPVVWEFFKDVPRVARCLPGAEYTGSPSAGTHAGKVTSKLGPFAAHFEGEAAVTYDEGTKTVRADGKGVDRKGNSRSKLGLDCRLVPEGPATKVIVEADIQLSGAIAQFGRTGLINEVASVLIGDFVRNAEAELAAPVAAPQPASPEEREAAVFDHGAPARTFTPSQAPSLSIMRLMMAGFKSWFRALFRRAA
jgi:carbon monoxide dehydrogenase subunit G